MSRREWLSGPKPGARGARLNTSHDELAESFRRLSDEVLMRRLHSGGMESEVLAVATAELQARGIEPAQAGPATVPEAEPEALLESTRGLVTIERLLDPTEAQIIVGRLETEGIPAFIADLRLVQTNWLWTLALGGVRLQVPGELAPQALEVIAALRAGHYALDEGAAPEQPQQT